MHAFVITGFLGVGKTTLLTNTVKQHFGDKNIAIIVNEFGDVGIDSKLLKNVHSEVLEISEGCICCKLAQEFESGVTEIVQKYNPDIIFVETSGASEPFPIFMSLQNLGVAVEGVICVCDAAHFDTYKENATAKYQIGGSNIIVLNKVDLVDAPQLERVKKEVADIKQQYNIKNNLTGETIFNSYVLLEAEQGIVGKEVFEGLYETEEIVGLAQEYRHDDHTHKDSITQKVLYLKEGIAFEDVDKVLQQLPGNIYRVKGVVKTTDVPSPLLVNYAFGNVSYEELPEYDEASLLILIGEAIDEAVKSLAQTHDFLMLPRFSIAK